LLEGLDPADIQACLRVFEVMESRLLASRREARHD